MATTPTTPFVQALAALLPPGFAFPRDPDSAWMRVLTGMAGSFGELHAVTEQATQEWLPHLTNTRLEEWEEAAGLPDGCFVTDQTPAARKAHLLARLRRPAGTYADSSATTTAGIEAAVANMGYSAVARYNTRFRCGRDRVGRRLGLTDGRFYVVATVGSTSMRIGDRVETRLVTNPPSAAEIACVLEAMVPARFELHVVFA